MIEWRDVYKVVAAMVPLYLALGLGFGSVRWWKIFTVEQCKAINMLVALFTIPFFIFEFTIQTNPYTMNYKFIASDTIAKLLIIFALLLWVKCGRREGSFDWSLTCFSLSTLNNMLVVGVPLVMAMYGKWAQDLIVQLTVIQGVVWFPALLFGFEVRKMKIEFTDELSVSNSERRDSVPLRQLIKNVWISLLRNPIFYASILGLAWACIAYKWRIELPTVVEGSIHIMSSAGIGTAMFSMGLFMAQQERIITCGPAITAFIMVLRFIVAPATALIGALAVGLRGDVLRLAIIQAALPQSIGTFVIAAEYGLHADVLSTAVIFGTLVSLPILVAYYIALDLIK